MLKNIRAKRFCRDCQLVLQLDDWRRTRARHTSDRSALYRGNWREASAPRRRCLLCDAFTGSSTCVTQTFRRHGYFRLVEVNSGHSSGSHQGARIEALFRYVVIAPGLALDSVFLTKSHDRRILIFPTSQIKFNNPSRSPVVIDRRSCFNAIDLSSRNYGIISGFRSQDSY